MEKCRQIVTLFVSVLKRLRNRNKEKPYEYFHRIALERTAIKPPEIYYR